MLHATPDPRPVEVERLRRAERLAIDPALAAAEAARRPRSAAWRASMSASAKARGHRLIDPRADPWTPGEDALLGTARDADVARLLGRATAAVRQRRTARGFPSFIVPVDGRRLKRLREARGWTVAELTKRAGMTRGAIGYLEGGERRATRRDGLAMLAKALGVGPDTLAASRG